MPSPKNRVMVFLASREGAALNENNVICGKAHSYVAFCRGRSPLDKLGSLSALYFN